MKKSKGISNQMDMLNGSIFDKILLFALPLAISSILQQLFNSVDVAVVGRFASSEALAAVGSNSSVISLLINLFVGISVGANVVIANYIGQGKTEKIQDAVHTVMIVSLISGVFLLVLGLMIARPILEIMGTPKNVIDLAVLYLHIYFLGMPFLMIYNFGAAVLRSKGDTKRPLYCLIISGVINACLNLLFVIVFKLSVAGVAIATVIADGVSAVLIIYFLMNEEETIRLRLNKLKIKKSELIKVIKIGVPAGLQGVVFSVSNVCIQTAINSFGSDVIAGYSAAIKLNTFAITSFSTLGNAMSSYTAQNTGARKLLRIPEGLKAGIVMLIVVSLPFFIAYFVFPNTMMNIFVKSSEAGIIDVGRIFLKIVTPFYFVISAKLTFDGILRGAGRMRAFMASTFTDLLLRVILAYVFSYALNSEVGIWLSWPVGWTIAAVISAVFYFIYYKTTIKNGAN